jgi:hypothetical protein
MSNSAGPKITKDGLVLDFDAANPKSYNFYADSYASSVSLYLQMNGANGSTTFTDSSPNALAVTAVGNAQISTTQSKYNGTSAYFDGTNSYISCPIGSSFAFGTGDFTFECWINMNDVSGFKTIFITGTGNSVGNFALYLQNGTEIDVFGLGGGPAKIAAAVSISTGTWYHLVVCRGSGTMYCFVDGILKASVSDSTNWTSTSGSVRIGQDPIGSYYFNGFIDNLKVTKGICRYTSAFTSPPIPSTCTDLTRSKNVGTLTGGLDYNFSNGGSLVFDGSNDYVNIPASTNLTFGTGDFTMEVWCKTRAKTNLYPALLSVNLAWAANVWVLIDRHNATAPTKFTFHAYNIGSPLLTSVTATSNGVWYNVVVTRIGTLFSMYINGVLESTATSSASLDGGVSNSINLGRQSASDSTNYDGNISHARIYKARGLTSTEVYNNFVANRGRFGV